MTTVWTVWAILWACASMLFVGVFVGAARRFVSDDAPLDVVASQRAGSSTAHASRRQPVESLQRRERDTGSVAFAAASARCDRRLNSHESNVFGLPSILHR
jgi:hypothetical protein